MPTEKHDERAMSDERAMGENLALLIRRTPHFGMCTAVLKHIISADTYIITGGTIHQLPDDADDTLQALAKTCERLSVDYVYKHYANHKTFRCSEDFWNTTDEYVKTSCKRMSDQRLKTALRLAATSDIPIYYQKDKRNNINAADRLYFDEDTRVTPLMCFERHETGISYRLQLRVGEQTVERCSASGLVVLGFEPALLILGTRILTLPDGASGKLLLPFVQKDVVEIPRRMENDYFHRFILKHVSRSEVTATGFDIDEVRPTPAPMLSIETSVDRRRMLSLRFRYGHLHARPPTEKESDTDGDRRSVPLYALPSRRRA